MWFWLVLFLLWFLFFFDCLVVWLLGCLFGFFGGAKEFLGDAKIFGLGWMLDWM
ncbi:MAG: hypothetical protein BTN85_2108 [Candidatus Methanohalarchaeum thermophilum]|uniref:Uncharacterized protein n=1 Tax=Methanohalarchaeum thermophilum TaxID=1903181 RepID=A0A1Q6DSZ7_METT1|nr:MAG: hypothetical protein BTN85_2108 [Candidatus Methanohalarchaeum thermophilum]